MTTLPSTADLARDWRAAATAVQAASKRLVEAREYARQCEINLATKIAPTDIRDGEQIGVWIRVADHSEVLVTVTRRSIEGLTLEERR